MFWRGVLGYLPVNLVQAIAGFGSIVVFTRLLSPADYGAYALGFSVASLVYTCLLTWIEAAMARFHAAEAEGPERDALYGTLYRTFGVMVLAAPPITVAALLLLPLPNGLRFAIGAGLASIAVRSLLKVAQEARRAAGRVKGFAVYDMAQTGGAFLLGIVFVLMGFGGAGPLLGLGVASGICLMWALPSELAVARRGRFDRARLARYAAYGLPISLSLVMSLALSTTDRFVLAGFMGEGAVGAYHAGYTLSNRTLDILFIWLGMAGGPAAIAALERGGEAALREVASDQAELMAFLALPAATGLALVAHPLAQLMVGEALREQAARVTPWIAMSALCAGVTTYYLHTAFTLARRTSRLMVAMAVPAAANLGLTLALIPRFGLDGAMWATTASYALGLVAAFALGRSCLRLPIPWTGLAKCGLASALMAVAVLRLPAWGGVAELAAKAMVGALVYAAATFALDAGGARSKAMRAAGVLRARAVRPAA